MSAIEEDAGHDRVDRVADEPLQFALTRRRPISMSDRRRGLGGEDGRGAARVSGARTRQLGPIGSSPHVRGETIVLFCENTWSICGIRPVMSAILDSPMVDAVRFVEITAMVPRRS